MAYLRTTKHGTFSIPNAREKRALREGWLAEARSELAAAVECRRRAAARGHARASHDEMVARWERRIAELEQLLAAA